MFIIYDIKEKTLNSRTVLTEIDPLTRSKSNVQLDVYQQYMSLFGPFGPISMQQVRAIDLERHIEIPKKEWSEELKSEAQNLKADTPFAWRLFRNIYIIAGVFVAMSVITPIVNKNRAEKAAVTSAATAASLAAVAPGDILRVFLMPSPQMTEPQVTLMKVVRIDGDTLVVKGHKEVKKGFSAEDASALDHDDVAFNAEEKKYSFRNFKNNKLISEFPEDAHKNIGTALDAVKSGS